MAMAITFGELQTEIGQQILRLVHVIGVDRANMQSVASSGQRQHQPAGNGAHRSVSAVVVRSEACVSEMINDCHKLIHSLMVIFS